MSGLVIIPVRKDSQKNPFILEPIGGVSSLVRTVNFARGLTAGLGIRVDLVVATDDTSIRSALAAFGDVLIPQRRCSDLEDALTESLIAAESTNKVEYELVFVFEPANPFRPVELARQAYELIEQDLELDSVVAAEPLRGRIWAQEPALQALIDSVNAHPWGPVSTYREMVGLMQLSRREVIMARKRIGEKVGLVVVDKKWTYPEVSSEDGLSAARQLTSLHGS